MKRCLFAAAALLALSALAVPLAFALGKGDSGGKDSDTEAAQQDAFAGLPPVKLEGRVRLVGNMPFPEIVITDDENQDWYVPREDELFQQLFDLQQQRVNVTAVYEKKDLILADGKKVGVRRILHHVKLRR